MVTNACGGAQHRLGAADLMEFEGTPFTRAAHQGPTGGAPLAGLFRRRRFPEDWPAGCGAVGGFFFGGTGTKDSPSLGGVRERDNRARNGLPSRKLSRLRWRESMLFADDGAGDRRGSMCSRGTALA